MQYICDAIVNKSEKKKKKKKRWRNENYMRRN